MNFEKYSAEGKKALKPGLNAIAVLALAVVFNQFFSYTKHAPALAAVIPFSEDPYDAVNSIAMILSCLLAVLSAFRVVQAHLMRSSGAPDDFLIARTQIAVPLSVLVALGSDAVAMLRHPAEWIGKAATVELLALLAAMAALSIAVLLVVRASVLGIINSARHRTQNLWKRASVILLLCIAALALFPEKVIQNVSLHFMAILLGFVILIAPQSALAVALLPYTVAEKRINAEPSRLFSRPWMQWCFIALLGMAVGACALLAEVFERGGGSVAPARILLVSSVFLGAGTSGLLIAFAFLKKPLGLFRKTSS
jgi:hypothetical protein